MLFRSAGAAMRALYDSAAKERQVEAVVKRHKAKKSESLVVAKVPQLGVDKPDTSIGQEATQDAVEPKAASLKTRDQVGKLVGVSGRYIDDATKQKQGSDVPP